MTIREWRIRRLREAIADTEHDKKFVHYPSHIAKRDRKIARLQRRLDRLSTPGNPAGGA